MKKIRNPVVKDLKRQFYKRNKLALMLSVVMTLLAALSNLAISWMMQRIIDVATGADVSLSLLSLVIISAGMVGGLAIIYLLDYYFRPRYVYKAMRQYKERAFELLSQKSINSFSGENTSTYISALSNDATSIETNYISKIFGLIQELLMFVGAFAMMLYYSPYLTLVAFGLSILPVLASILTGNRLAKQEKAVSAKNEGFMSTLKDVLTGFSVIKSFKAEREARKLFNADNAEAENAKCHRKKTEILISAIGNVAGVIAQFGVFLFGAYLAVSGKGVTAGVVIVFVQLMNFVIMPIADVPQILANRKAANGLIEKLADAISSNVRREGKAVDNKLDDAITVKNLSFSYDDEKVVLDHISASFETGKSYALVGGSGSGKSTLLNLLMGSSEKYSGEIFFDGDELRSISSDSLYDLVSIVQQNVFVFNSSIMDNITMFRDFEADRVNSAIEMSGLGALIGERGGDYACGENGSGLSGGERQRISIARTLLKGSPVMLVDEATAALDTETAFSVTNSILDLGGLTRIIVTHRLEEALMKRYDCILCLKNGSIEERGSFDELMARKGYFYSLFMVSQ